MDDDARLASLLAEFDLAWSRLDGRMSGPDYDSGDGEVVPTASLTDDEYLWEPAPRSWSLRRKVDGPGQGATTLVGSGAWGCDDARPQPVPPPVTTIAWRLHHLTAMLVLRTDHTTGAHVLSADDLLVHGDAAGAIVAFGAAASAWREVLAGAGGELDTVGFSSYPDGSDAVDRFVEVVWWTNQELAHHGAEIALLRDLYRALSD